MQFQHSTPATRLHPLGNHHVFLPSSHVHPHPNNNRQGQNNRRSIPHEPQRPPGFHVSLHHAGPPHQLAFLCRQHVSIYPDRGVRLSPFKRPVIEIPMPGRRLQPAFQPLLFLPGQLIPETFRNDFPINMYIFFLHDSSSSLHPKDKLPLQNVYKKMNYFSKKTVSVKNKITSL